VSQRHKQVRSPMIRAILLASTVLVVLMTNAPNSWADAWAPPPCECNDDCAPHGMEYCDYGYCSWYGPGKVCNASASPDAGIPDGEVVGLDHNLYPPIEAGPWLDQGFHWPETGPGYDMGCDIPPPVEAGSHPVDFRFIGDVNPHDQSPAPADCGGVPCRGGCSIDRSTPSEFGWIFLGLLGLLYFARRIRAQPD
jgi:hypothetical protein